MIRSNLKFKLYPIEDEVLDLTTDAGKAILLM